MVAIALLGFFPGLSGDTKKAQSDTYWRGSARPFAITGASCSGGSAQAPKLMIQNLDTNTKVLNISLTDGTVNLSNRSQTRVLAGESVSITLHNGESTFGLPTLKSGKTYEFNVTITYNTTNGIQNAVQRGTKPLVVICG
jgi:type 1 fimbria pilin